MTRYRYVAPDLERRVAEPVKGGALPTVPTDIDAGRSAFARDRARVLHCTALRSLAGKTQVVGPGEGAEVHGAPRTRLTHSLEVAQIGRGLADHLGADPDVVETAGLAHDIGHPPFGHNGERALDEAATSCGGFEANAQTLRILTRLEPKVLDADGHPHGLNLTRATLDATVKYPWRRTGPGKFGYFTDDTAAFDWVRTGARSGKSVESQIMDWADDVAYSVHDVEDGVVSGRIDPAVLADPVARAELLAMVRAARGVGGGPSDDALGLAAAELPGLAAVSAVFGYDGSHAARVALSASTSELVGRFVTAVVAATRAAYGDRPCGRYSASLVIPEQVAAEVAVLKAVAVRYVVLDRSRLTVQARQRELLGELVDGAARRAPESLDAVMRPAWHAAPDDAARLRVVIDQVAALTDAQAVRWRTVLAAGGAAPAAATMVGPC